jgi:hypothetical protein
MTKSDKLKNRFIAEPCDFSWQELEKLLASLSFYLIKMGKTSGSSVKFYREGYPPIHLHKPHPGKILKAYQMKYIREYLEEEDLL